MTFNEGDFLIYLIPAGVTLLLAAILGLAYMSYKKNSSKLAYDEQLQDLLTDENDPDFSPKLTLSMRWNEYWAKIAKDSGMLRYNDIDNTAGRDLAVLAVSAGLALSVVFRNPLIGAGAVTLMVFLASLVLKSFSSKKEEAIRSQMPGFIFAFKANVQGNTTAERAFLKVIDGMPSPLYDELVVVKNRLVAQSTFKEALEEVSYKTTSRELRFLCACLIQASGAGANLESQLDTIQKVLEDRQRVSDSINRAVKTTTPTVVVASVAIPGLFIGAYMIDPNSQQFWFKEPVSWAALVAIIVFWTGGILFAKRSADSIKKL